MLNLLRAFAIGGYAAIQCITQWNLDFTEHNEEGDRLVNAPASSMVLTSSSSEEFLRGVANPLGIKLSSKMDPNKLVKLIEILNPQNKPRRITVITRLGAENIGVKLPPLIWAVRGAGQIVTWVSDPVHGNTIKAPYGLKTRPFDSIMNHGPFEYPIQSES